MTAVLPALALEEFRRRLPPDTPGEVASRLYPHYEQLRRWAARMALVAQSTADEAVERHYVESLAAVELLPSRGRLVDLGSGAGFPGLVLAAARPDLDVTLVERRHRKAAFLRSAGRAMGVEVEVSTESVGREASHSLAENVDCLTARAIRFDSAGWERLVACLGPAGRLLLWCGAEDVDVPGFRVRSARRIGGADRRILEYERITRL